MAPDNTIRIPNAITVPTPALAHDVVFTAPDGTEIFVPTLELVELHADERYGLAFTVVVSGDMQIRPPVGAETIREALARESALWPGSPWVDDLMRATAESGGSSPATETTIYDRLAAERRFRL